MTAIAIPTGKDIHIEVEGKKVAMVQSCTTKTTRQIQDVEVFGSQTPVATVGGKQSHVLELKKVMVIQQSVLQNQDFYELSDFTVMIVKPDCRIVYDGCQWSSIGQTVSVNSPCIENIQVIAKKRMVIWA